MATMNAVMKAIESLNALQQGANIVEQSTRKSEKTTCCLAIVNGICSATMKNSRNFGQVLGLSIKTLLSLCDDEESDVRTVADECLNRIIRSMSDGNVLKIQFELYNEIHRNGSWRSLRAALRRFGLLSHTIKPMKGKPYISNLIPCIVAISKRSEEAVIDTLSQTLPLILKTLGQFMMDKDAKTLLKAFYPNLSSPQATLRRNAANMILTTCLHCRKPKILLFYVLQYLIDTMIPVSQVQENLHQVVGVLGCLRIMLPHVDSTHESDVEAQGHSIDCLLQIYELSLRYIQWHSDHNVVNAALETLAQLLRSANEELISLLTAKNGISGGSKIVMYERTIKLSSSDCTTPDDSAQASVDEDVFSSSAPVLDKVSENDLQDDKLINECDSQSVEDRKIDDESRKIVNIGSFTDCDVPLKYCCRYLTSCFLLTGTPGQLVTDKSFRVSVKSLALTCIGSIVRLYPKIFVEKLEKSIDTHEKNCQMISDILLFAEHSDPQLRGNVALIIGLFLNSVYVKYRSNYKTFLSSINERHDDKTMNLENLITLLIRALEDESATTCRQALNALNICLVSLLNSEDSGQGLRLIYKLLPIADNVYFLVKINLVQVLSELPYITIKYLTGSTRFQQDVMAVLIKLLNDDDPRVRHAVSETIVQFTITSYHEKPHENETIRKASCYVEQYLTPVTSINPIETTTYRMEHKVFVNGLSEPFYSFYMENCRMDYHHGNIEDSLSIIIGLLVEKLIINSSKYFIYGCFGTLCQLSQIYPTTLYPDAWDCRVTKMLNKKTLSKVHSSNRSISSETCMEIPTMCNHLTPISVELLCMTLSLVISDTVSLDLSTHRHLIQLAGNLLSGIALKNLKTIDISEINDTKERTTKMWNLFENTEINYHLELLFQHIMRLINIYVHVIDDIQVVMASNKSSGLPSLPSTSSLSPRKKIGAHLDQRLKERGDKGPINLSKAGKEFTGSFYSLTHYIKLHELLKAAHVNYQSTLDAEASQMYLGLLHTTLQVLSQILEIASTYEARKIAEEVLHCLETTVGLSATHSVQCVRQLLKSLFGMNLTSRWDELEDVKNPDDRPVKYQLDDQRKGLYDRCFQKPAKIMVDLLKKFGNNCRDSEANVLWDEGNSSIGSRRDSNRKLAMVFKSFARSNNQKAFFASFIRIFEPMVIKSLNLYTTTTSIDCQCEVLCLLSQLVQFHVNYCLLDTDKTFIDFVLGQFAFIEESQIQQTERLIPKIFDFLVHLSYEKFHTKVIIDIREIIKLCDGLMASGQSPVTHCIPAIIPVVEDIFFVRSTSSKSTIERAELETTREYLLSMLLRLVEYHQIIELLAQCLVECRRDEDGEDKWRKWSRMTIDAVIPALSTGRIKIEYEDAAIALIKLFAAVSSTVFRPVDPLLKTLFTVPPALEDAVIKHERWLGMVNIILLTLISHAKEEIMLARFSEMNVYITDLVHALDLPDIYLINDSVDPLNATNVESYSLDAERIFSSFIFRVILLATSKIRQVLEYVNYCDNLMKSKETGYLVKQLTFFLQLCIHMFESGSHCKIAQATIIMLREEKILSIEQLNQSMYEISRRNYPILTCQWIYLMTLLGYSDPVFWLKMMGNKNRKDGDKDVDTLTPIKAIDTKILNECATILFCDYICENFKDTESLSWLLMNHIEDTMYLANEQPVRDLVNVAVHRNSAASGLIVQAIAARCLDLSQPSFVRKLLLVLDSAHDSQSGAVILAIIPRFICTTCLAIARMAVKIAERRVELLLGLSSEDVHDQISKADLSNLMETLQSTKLARKYGELIERINNLAARFYDLSPLELEQCRPFNPRTVKDLQLDKQWFISQVKLRCCNLNVSYAELAESAKLLIHLDLDDCHDILLLKEFDVRIFEECIKLGLRLTLVEDLKLSAFITTKDCEAAKPKENSKCLSALYRATKHCLSSHVRSINNLMPKPHYVYDPLLRDDGKSSKAMKYVAKFSTLLNDQIYWDRLFAIIPAVTIYMKSLAVFHDREINCVDPSFDDEDLAKFAVLCLEAVHWMIHMDEEGIRSIKPHELELCLTCSTDILANENICRVFGSENHYTWIGSVANTLSRLVKFWLVSKNNSNALPQVDSHGLTEALNNEATRNYAHACLQMAGLICWLEQSDFQNKHLDIPSFVCECIITLIIIVSRQELVNSFVLTPPMVWKHGWHTQGTGPTLCHFPLLLPTAESNYLQELDILGQFVYRITLLGWTSRQQFEEMWMALLGVLSGSANVIDDPEAYCRATKTAVQGITRLLGQTLLLPNPGSPVNSYVMHHSRDSSLSLQKPASQRLYTVQDILSWEYMCARDLRSAKKSSHEVNTESLDLEHLFTRGNIERDRTTNGHDYFSYSQLSVLYHWSSCCLHEDKLSTTVIELKERRQKALVASCLDLDSCVKFLIELYSRWLLPDAEISAALLVQVVNSIIAISELFVERSQFQWMFDTCWEIERLHSTDDEILHHSVIFAICKSAAVLVPLDIESLDKVKRATDVGLKSTYLPCRIATLHGILYLLQSAVQANCDETMNIVYPLAIKYLQKHIDTMNLIDVAVNDSEEHQRVMWTLVFFLLEYADDAAPDTEVPAVLESIFLLANASNISIALHRTLLQGMERLIATKSVNGRIVDQIVRLSLDRLKQPCFLHVLPALRLLLTCMYTEAADRFNRTAISMEEQPLPDIEPEALMRTIERTSAIFDRIKKGHSMEVKIFCTILSEILGDFFPPFETLTKVIGEFLSPLQPHPRLISGVVFKVCERVAGNVDQLALLQDWVVFSLPNFIQSLPLVTSTWCLSCFFVSASTNHWLRALFPHVQSRIGKYEYEDKKILCIAALDFYRKLSNESQRQAFIDSLSPQECEPSSPFSDIITTLHIASGT